MDYNSRAEKHSGLTHEKPISTYQCVLEGVHDRGFAIFSHLPLWYIPFLVHF